MKYTIPENHITQRLNKLFLTICKPNGRPYTNAEAAIHIGIAASTISRLRTGRETNPTFRTLYDICEFFGVDIAYFDPNDDGRLPRPPQSPTSTNAAKLELVEEILEKVTALKELMKHPS